MKHRTFKISQTNYDEIIENCYRLGYQMGQIKERDWQWTRQHGPLTFVEKQLLAILQKKGF